MAELETCWLDPAVWPDAGLGMYVLVDENGPNMDNPVIWVNDTPSDVSSPEGHFEVYEGDPSAYYFKMRESGYLENGKFVADGKGLIPDNTTIPDAAEVQQADSED